MLSVLECFRFDVPFLFFFFFVCVSRIWFLEWERSRERRRYKYPHGTHIYPIPYPKKHVQIPYTLGICGICVAVWELAQRAISPANGNDKTTKPMVSIISFFLIFISSSLCVAFWMGWLAGCCCCCCCCSYRLVHRHRLQILSLLPYSVHLVAAISAPLFIGLWCNLD